MIGLVVLLAALGAWLREPTTALAQAWVEATGLGGLFVAAVLVDAVPQPVPPDVFTGFALVGGLPFWAVGGVATAGSMLGGSLGWALARWASSAPPVRRVLQRGKAAELQALVRRYGGLSLAIGALTPVPFSLTCYGAGATGYPFSRLVLLSLLRAPRLVGYMWLMELGWMSVG